MKAVLGLLLVLLPMTGSWTVLAHEIRPALLELVQTDETSHKPRYNVRFKVPIREGKLLRVEPVFPVDCESTHQQIVRHFEHQTATWQVSCRDSLSGRAIALDGLAFQITDVLLRVESPGGQVTMIRATPDNPVVSLPDTPDSEAVAATYFVLGVEHILLGPDHLIFVLALLLLIRGVSKLVWTITAFTLAHSVTLVGTSLGWVSLPSAPVEAVIALSIMFLACELAIKDRASETRNLRLSERLPWLVAGSFGLLHGFGFAGALADIGLPPNDLPLGLLCFNLGVEAGQLVFVAFMLFVLYWIRPLLVWPRIEWGITYGIGSLSGFWLIERLI